mgnify:FL=1
MGKVVFVVADKWNNRNAHESEASIKRRMYHCMQNISRAIVNVNVFETAEQDEFNVRKQRLYTRIYLVLFISCLGVLLFYTAIIKRNIIKPYAFNSVEEYEHCHDSYRSGASCPCSRISIPYSDFITEFYVSAFHEVCKPENIYEILFSGILIYLTFDIA